jgi:acyl carrier protein
VEWLDDEHLRTVQIRPAALPHPRTGERLWFNHALALHASSLDPALRQTLLRQRGEAGLPHNTYFGNGDPIPDEVIAHVRETHERQQILFDWQAGDVLLLDNLRMAHGREPYSGPRAVYAAMGNPLSWREVGATLEVPAAWPRFAGGEAEAPRHPNAAPLDDRGLLRGWFVAAVAAELGLDAVDPTLGFAELGGDSMSGVMVIDQLMDRFGLDLSLDTLLESRSLDEVVSALEA